MVLISKANKRIVYQNLFEEGVMVVKKDPTLENHSEVAVPNLHVMMLLRSLHSRNYVDEKFTWQYHYYTLNNEGIEYLREQLHLGADAVPVTMKKGAPRGMEADDRKGGFGNKWGKADQ